MKRLTKREVNGKAYFDYKDISFPDKYSKCFGVIADKLANYEDADDKNQLLILPFPLTQKHLYALDGDDVLKLETENFSVNKDDFENEIVFTIDSMDYHYDDFGKIIFLSEKEAFEALANLNKAKNLKLVDMNELIKLIDSHTNDKNQLDDDITCILEELTVVSPEKYITDSKEDDVGEWIYNNRISYKCSKCGNIVDKDHLTSFCSECGRKMINGEW